MPELIVKYKGAKALKALQDLTKGFAITIEAPKVNEAAQKQETSNRLPITFAKNPDIKALAGIWQDRNITIEDLRKEALGG